MKKKRILVVDDSPSITAMLKIKLEAGGLYEVVEENHAGRTLETIRVCRPDVILLDVMMPEMDGGDIDAQLREDPLLRQIPVIFLTSAVTKAETTNGTMKIRGRLFLAKPVDIDEVCSCVAQSLGNGR